MRQSMQVLLAIFVLTSISAFADTKSLTNLNVNFVIQPNNGSGGNVGGTIFGPGLNLTVGGGFYVSYFSDLFGSGFAPGSTGGGGTPILVEFLAAEIGSQSMGLTSLDSRPQLFSTPDLSHSPPTDSRPSPSPSQPPWTCSDFWFAIVDVTRRTIW